MHRKATKCGLATGRCYAQTDRSASYSTDYGRVSSRLSVLSEPTCLGTRKQRPIEMLHSELFGCHLMVAATIPKDGPVTRSQPSLGAQRIEARVASGRSPYQIRSSAARLPEVCKSGIRATIRNCPPGRSLALRVACEMTQAREAVVSTLQAVRIIVGIIFLSGCRQCCEHHGYKRRSSNDLAHFNFSS